MFVVDCFTSHFQMGYDGVYFFRADYQDIKNRMAKKELELIWRGSDTLRKEFVSFLSNNLNKI